MLVVDSTRAESAFAVDVSAALRAATGLIGSDPLPPWPPPEPDPDPQAATPVSAATAAIESVVRRTVLFVISPHPYAFAVSRTLARTTDNRTEEPYRRLTESPTGIRGESIGLQRTPVDSRKRDEPRNRSVAGLVVDRCEPEAQTAAGSSSTRRLRVRFGSIWMPGPIVVLMAAFLM
ncbi:hypothetical protein GCM10023336_51160 [Streptomyces similanensis]|uniref:Uncharacterized protein n=1 Tax=Streptomyces similanensis TaxID=1274988 RepID=A0ABP9L2R8_9ACTN